MVLFFSLAVLYTAFIYIFELFQDNFINKIFSLLLGSFVFYVLLYHVTYNSDWEMYEAIFRGETASGDMMFNFISESFSSKGYDYSSVYKLHIFLIGAGFIYFASRNTYSNVFGIITTYLVFQLIPVSNQIRYYVGFSFFLIAIYNLLVSKNRIVFFVFSILSLLSHSAILLMYPFLYFYYYTNKEKYIQKLILYGFVLAGFFYFIFLVGFVFSFHFGSYFDNDFLSSFSGGIFNNFIWLLWFLFIYWINKRLVETNSEPLESDIMYQFLYKLSLYSLLFLPVSIVLQVLSSRYIQASFIVWVSFFYYSLNYELSLKKRLVSISFFLLLIVITFIYVYILPSFLLGKSATEDVFDLFLSNQLFFNTI